MKRILAAIFLLVVITWQAEPRAQEGSGGTRSIFSVGAGSRAIAMGGAFSAIGDDPAAIYYNPAALRMSGFPGIMVNHIQLFSGFSDATYDFIGLVYPTLSAGSIGLGFMTAGTGGIREFDSFSREAGEISYRESQGMLAYAFDLPWEYLGKFTLGSTAKILNQRVGDFSDAGAGFDVGLIYRPPRITGIVLGCNLQDIIGAETKLVTVSERVYRTLMFGAGYSYLFENGSTFNLAVQMDIPERADSDFRLGAEYNFKQFMSLRVGFDSEQITAGVGIAWHGFEFDYGFFNREEVGSSHPVSLSARIGTPIEEKIRIREQRRLAEEERRLREVFTARISGHLEAAGNYRRDGDLESALDELKIVLEYDPANEAAAETLAVVRNEILAEQRSSTESAGKALLINQHFGLGLKYYSGNEYILARMEWRNVLELDPENEQAKEYLLRTEEKLAEQVTQHRVRALELERRGQLAEALSEWNMIRMINPEYVEARSSSERIAGRMEDLSRGYRTASRRLRLIELFEDALTAFSGGRYQRAIDLSNRILEIDPIHEEARNLLRRAQRRLIPLTDEDKEEIRRLYIEGMKHFTRKNYTAAIEEWRKIMEIDPDNESVRKNIEEAEMRLEKIGSPEAE